MANGRPRAPQLGPTPTRVRKALRAFREHAIYARAAEAAGVDDSTLRTWRDADPELQAKFDAISVEYDRRIGQTARACLSKELEAQLDGVPVRTPHLDRQGKVHILDMPRPLNIAAVRTALTKLDPSWVKPKPDEGDQALAARIVENLSRYTPDAEAGD